MNHLHTILQCPKCNSVVAFEYAAANLKTCTCGSVLQKINNELKIINSLNNVIVKGYNIKPGTTGEWQKKHFKVLGKMGVWFEESFYSYWFILFNEGHTGFLAEGYGMYSILIPEKNPVIKNSDLQNKKIGQLVTLTDYQLQKKNSSYYWEVEGELWLDNYSAYFDVYEYAGESGNFFTIFKWANDVADAYHNNPVSFDTLSLKNTQQVNPFGKEFKCPKCFKAIKMITYPLAQSCTCNSCGTFYAIERNHPDKKGNNSNSLFEPLIALGTKGVLKGITYEVVGYAKKQEQNAYKSKWKEYVLFNAAYGFAFLSEYDGHWIFLKETILCPVILNDNTKEFEFANESFHLFNSYTYSVIEAKGEFPYNIFDNKNTLVKEYISPPEIWIREKDNAEGITWFFGEHITTKEITNAFALTASAPYRRGIGAVQPSNYINIKKLVTVTLVAIVALLLIHLLLISNKQNKVITEDTYYFTDSLNKVKIVTEKFELDKWRSNLAFDIAAPVDNGWFELAATLVNTETGKEYSVEQGVEYYHGYTDGENWKEGSTAQSAYITSIPAGKYFLELEGTRENVSFQGIKYFNVKATYDAVDYRNFWFAVLLIIIWPLLNYVISNQKEQSRWGNSPFSNYKTD